ncbi:MAG: hypothetical protein P8100_13905, partial [bacterium]
EKYFPDYYYLERRVGTFEGVNGKSIEMRLMDLTYFSGDYAAYRTHAYNRPAMAYYYLQDALGDSLFKVGLNAYIKIWNGRHPTPYDFFNSFMYGTGQKLDWFFKPWFYDRSYADLAIRKITMDNKIVIENIGGLPLPVVISCEYEDGTLEIYTENTAIWSSGEQAMVFQVNGRKKIRKVILGTDRIPDINESNNVLHPVYE